MDKTALLFNMLNIKDAILYVEQQKIAETMLNLLFLIKRTRLNSLKHHNRLNFYLKLNGKLKFRLNQDLAAEKNNNNDFVELDSDF